jgi:hypothetical protein
MIMTAHKRPQKNERVSRTQIMLIVEVLIVCFKNERKQGGFCTNKITGCSVT